LVIVGEPQVAVGLLDGGEADGLEDLAGGAREVFAFRGVAMGFVEELLGCVAVVGAV
jgi:hypothetical protein